MDWKVCYKSHIAEHTSFVNNFNYESKISTKMNKYTWWPTRLEKTTGLEFLTWHQVLRFQSQRSSALSPPCSLVPGICLGWTEDGLGIWKEVEEWNIFCHFFKNFVSPVLGMSRVWDPKIGKNILNREVCLTKVPVKWQSMLCHETIVFILATACC